MTKKIFTTAGLLLLLVLPARAADQGGIELKSTAQVDITVKNDKGINEVIRVDAATANVVPGDTVIFTTNYANLGSQPATDVVINNPVAEHMTYVAGSAEGIGTRIEFSINNGKTFARPEQLKIKTADGKERLAGAADYTHIRWTILGEIGPGAKGFVSYKGKVK
jgi:uncharacterized repeat protein (TIGR01451 family)